MVRGTTPTLNFILPFDCGYITKLNIAFSQRRIIVLEKELEDCSIDTESNTISVTLSENDTLTLSGSESVEIQLRVACGETKLASKIIKTFVSRILKDGCL